MSLAKQLAAMGAPASLVDAVPDDPEDAWAWSERLEGLMGLAIAIGMVSSVGGLLLSYHAGLPSGPCIILLAGVIYLLSALFGRYHSVFARWRRRVQPMLPPDAHG